MFRRVAIAATIVAAGLVLDVLYLRWHSRVVVMADIQPGQVSVESTLDEETARRLVQVMVGARDRLGAPSLQVAVVTRDRGWWTGSVGWTDPTQRRAVTVRDPYHIGSVSKLYTAAAILRLAEEGLLSLDDPVDRFVAGIPNGNLITVRQLLNHTSGLYNYTADLSFQFRTVILRNQWTVDQVLDLIRAHKPYFAPGAGHYYSNSNYVLLGVIAERAGGQPFSAVLQEKLLEPLDLHNTFFAPQEELPDNAVRGYDATLLGLGKLGIKKDMTGLQKPFETSAFAAGGVVASALDVARFTHGLFEGGVLRFSSIRSMSTFAEAPDEDVPEQTGYGLGLRRLRIGGAEFKGHTGIFPGFSNVAMYSPERGYAVVVLANLSVVQVNSVIEDIQMNLAETP